MNVFFIILICLGYILVKTSTCYKFIKGRTDMSLFEKIFYIFGIWI